MHVSITFLILPILGPYVHGADRHGQPLCRDPNPPTVHRPGLVTTLTCPGNHLLGFSPGLKIKNKINYSIMYFYIFVNAKIQE